MELEYITLKQKYQIADYHIDQDKHIITFYINNKKIHLNPLYTNDISKIDNQSPSGYSIYVLNKNNDEYKHICDFYEYLIKDLENEWPTKHYIKRKYELKYLKTDEMLPFIVGEIIDLNKNTI